MLSSLLGTTSTLLRVLNSKAFRRAANSLVFGAVIDTLDLDLILPEAEVAALDQMLADVVAKLEALDPATLVGDTLREAYAEDVLPLVEALDVTPVLNALIEAMRGLELQLEQEMERINTAYGALLSARPAAASGGLSVGSG